MRFAVLLVVFILSVSSVTIRSALAEDVYADVSDERGTYKRFWGNFGTGKIMLPLGALDGDKLFSEIGRINSEVPETFRIFRSPNMYGDLYYNDINPSICDEFSGSRCVRWHGVYREDENGNPVYDFSRLDEIYHKIVDNGMVPLVELSFMPRELLSPDKCKETGCGDEWYLDTDCIKNSCIGKWGQALMGPPKDWEKWQELVRRTVLHLISEFGKDEVEKWYFEVWNEHNYKEFYLSDEDYARLYEYSVRGAEDALPGIKIGGTAPAGYHMNEYWLNYILSRDINAGFYSYHQYRKRPSDFLDGIDTFAADIEDIYSARGMTFVHDKQIIASEYGPATTGVQSHEWWKTSFPAAWYFDTINKFFDKAQTEGNYDKVPDEMILWAGVDKGDHGKGMATNSLDPSGIGIGKRPLFNAMQASGMLGNTRIRCSTSENIECFATTHKGRSVQVVIYRIEIPNSNDEIIQSPAKEDVEVLIDNIPFTGSYDVSYYIIDSSHSNCENPDSFRKDYLWKKESAGSGDTHLITLEPIEVNSVHMIVIGDITGNERESTCDELNGYDCSNEKSCSGEWFHAIDSEYCCSDVCVEICDDGTEYGACSDDKPYFCDEGELIEACGSPHDCGCPEGTKCGNDNMSCVQTDFNRTLDEGWNVLFNPYSNPITKIDIEKECNNILLFRIEDGQISREDIIEGGKSYLLRSDIECDVSFSGEIVNQDIFLKKGWNTIGFTDDIPYSDIIDSGCQNPLFFSIEKGNIKKIKDDEMFIADNTYLARSYNDCVISL